ncbi:precorrin-3B synthase [Lichenibacterium dinghuense]|uniref:precorrin-3B synthase n=1 Tax=Lichenibacterium dinghuense TaxID=2895977 RepID=UPI001F02DE10|nr:precorrin-3B synthase [Lichenibacterium sp. 6Y81]
MTAAAALRVGWCPGALRPMMSRDGLILRVKPRGMALRADRASGIAAAARRHGSGQLELTARANLQIRGVTEASLPALTVELDAMGLLDADAGAETRRNVVASPLMGLDPAAAFDVRPAVAALEAALAGAAGLDALPSKFGFAVADGGAMRLDDVPADVRFDALPGGRFAVRLDGDGIAAAGCGADELPEMALRLARAFVEAAAADAGLHRMRDLVAAVGAGEVLRRATSEAISDRGEPLPSPLSRGAGGEGEATVPEGGTRDRPLHGTPLAPSPQGPISARRDGYPRTPPHGGEGRRPASHAVFDCDVALGVAAPFGRLDAAQLDALARGAARVGAGELRLTPWRALLVPGLAPDARARLAADCAAAGLIVDPADPRLRVAACAGAPGCRRGSTPILADAAALAPLLGPGAGVALHVSGCAKGCAHPGPAPLTLVAAEGRYALVADGTAADAPAATGLDLAEAHRLLKTILRLDRRP